MNLYKIQKDEAESLDEEFSNFSFSISMFFTSIKSKLLEMWNSEIVSKSALFTSASIPSPPNSTESVNESKA